MLCNDWEQIVIGLGSNLSRENLQPIDHIRASIKCIECINYVSKAAESSFYQSPAWPVEVPPKPDYINAAIKIDTSLKLHFLMEKLLEIEHAFGRNRDILWQSRTLDIDILAVNGSIFPNREDWQAAQEDWRQKGIKEPVGSLFVPHLRLTERAFALKPLLDVAPDWVHPVTGRPYKDALALIPKEERDALKLVC